MRSVVAACLLALPLIACAEEGAAVVRSPVDGTAGALEGPARAQGHEQVVQRIAEATCERERSCGTIGPGAYFSSREQCLESVAQKYRPQLDPGQCPQGIDRRELDSCLESLEAGQCANPSDQITRSARCSASDLCIR
jgi:hypothetical protein